MFKRFTIVDLYKKLSLFILQSHIIYLFTLSLFKLSTNGETALHLACKDGHYDVVVTLLQFNASPGETFVLYL